ncbi:MAG: 4a-hydroxytetrahydrobiopterin dehydratase [Sandaracinaceae bacterium]|nr:4a-hydroxytetrahydrobiopterin dehydratase [Sandaracinaceae bacterium]
MGPLDESTIARELASLPGWAHEDAALRKTFQFGSFREAMSFLVRIAFDAEELGHHPEIHNVYSRVWITLRTHDAGNRVTALDVKLARAIERVCWI